jgi:hypothetical protein
MTGLITSGAAVLMLATMGRAVAFLVVALAVSYALWLVRVERPSTRRLLPMFLVAVLVQCAHLIEEVWSGFYRAFPPLLGSEPWSERQFVIFNLVWLALFLLTGLGIVRQWRPAYVITMFLAIGGGICNGLGHIALAIRANGYFPGAYTAPLVLAAGIALLVCHFPTVKTTAPAL